MYRLCVLQHSQGGKWAPAALRGVEHWTGGSRPYSALWIDADLDPRIAEKQGLRSDPLE
jgi:hypothetical protein